LFLVVAGFSVPKLGLQGRPAGGVDVMAQIPGFDISPSPQEVLGIIGRCGFAHFLADKTYAPLDQSLFRFRQELGAQAVPSLVVASILAKKLAVGVETAGLEVRVFPGGNFGENKQSAIKNARLFVKVAACLHIQATCFVTDCTVPYQPFIGRGEAILGLHQLFYGKPSRWVMRHAAQCWGFVGKMCRAGDDPKQLAEVLQQARQVFEQHLVAHGASPASLPALVSGLDQQHRHVVTSPGDGFVMYRLGRIRDFIVKQQRASPADRFPDPTGIELLKPPGDRVVRGEPVLKIRVATPSEPPPMEGELFSIAPAPAMPFAEHVIKAT
jgi:pyrimidine-nucleoside phosphorylase